MPILAPGDIWMIDFGMVAKVRPALLLTGPPADDELDLVTVLLHTTALRGNRWELNIPKPFLKLGAFHLQQVQTVSTVKLERRLGALNDEEMNRVLDALAGRLGILGFGPNSFRAGSPSPLPNLTVCVRHRFTNVSSASVSRRLRARRHVAFGVGVSHFLSRGFISSTARSSSRPSWHARRTRSMTVSPTREHGRSMRLIGK